MPTDSSATSYELEAIVQATGQVLMLPVGSVTGATFPGVPNGNFIVRVRGRNVTGASDYSPQRVVMVGVALGSGDLQATLTWNTTTDIDIHVVEPSQTEVYYANRTGPTARLDRDDTDGFGPETSFVAPGAAAPGTYRIFIIHYSGTPPHDIDDRDQDPRGDRFTGEHSHHAANGRPEPLTGHPGGDREPPNRRDHSARRRVTSSGPE